MTASLLASFKLRPFDRHAWVMPRDARAGVTLRGEAAAEAFALGHRLFALACPTAPERVRALSVDLDRARLLATLEDDPKPTAVRVDGDAVREALDPALLRYLEQAASRAV